MDCNPPFSSIHGILQTRILQWIAISFSRGSSQPRVQTPVSCIAGRFFTTWATRVGPLIYSFTECILLEKHCCQGLIFNLHCNSKRSTIICLIEEEADAERWSFWFKAIVWESCSWVLNPHTWLQNWRFNHSANCLWYQLDKERWWGQGCRGDLESRGDLGRSCPGRTCEHVGFLWNGMWSRPRMPEILS